MKNSKLVFGLTLLVTLFLTKSLIAQKLEFELLYKVDISVETGTELGKTPLGQRIVYSVKGGTFEGPKLKGKVRPTGDDWFLQIDSTTSKLDVRLVLETEDGALISNTYVGFIHNNSDGTRYWRIVPMFETSSKKYEWLNYTIAVGVGKGREGGVTYEVYAIK